MSDIKLYSSVRSKYEESVHCKSDEELIDYLEYRYYAYMTASPTTESTKQGILQIVEDELLRRLKK